MTLKIDNVSKQIGGRWSLRDIEFEAKRGEVFGIVGGSPDARSTLLSIIAGKTKAGSGSVTHSKGRFSTSFVAAGGRSEERSGFFGKKPSEVPAMERLSRVRAALESGSDVILLEEPLAGHVDADRKDLISAIRSSIYDGEKIVIVASNNFADIAETCGRICVLSNGESVQTGFVQQVYESPNCVGSAMATGDIALFSARRLTSTDSFLPEFFTIDGEHRLFAQQTEKKSLGAINQTITLGIRPEYVSITTGASFPEDNLLKAVVTDILFLGPLTRVEFEAGGLTLNASVFRIVGLNIGDDCIIALPPHRIHVFSR